MRLLVRGYSTVREYMPEDWPFLNSRRIKPPINLLLHPQRHGHRSRLISLALEIQKHPAAVAHREMIAVRARQFPAEQCARHQYRQQRPVPLSRGRFDVGGASAVRIKW